MVLKLSKIVQNANPAFSLGSFLLARQCLPTCRLFAPVAWLSILTKFLASCGVSAVLFTHTSKAALIFLQPFNMSNLPLRLAAPLALVLFLVFFLFPAPFSAQSVAEPSADILAADPALVKAIRSVRAQSDLGAPSPGQTRLLDSDAQMWAQLERVAISGDTASYSAVAHYPLGSP